MITTAVSLFVLMGMLGLSIDLGRVYIAKNEAQAFADIAAVTAARRLNGKATGLTNASADVTTSTNTNMWNFSSTKFGSNATTSPAPTVEYSEFSTGPWSANGGGNYPKVKFVRVTVTPSVNLAFLPAVGTALTQQVTGRAVGGVVPQTFPAGGYLPFTPFAHDASKDASGNLIDKDFGYKIGEEYGILWPGNINNKNNACHGDTVDKNENANWPAYNFSDNSVVAGSDRGYFELNSAAAIRDAILGGTQTDALNVGDYVDLTHGQKQTEQTALQDRANYDTDTTKYAYTTDGTKPGYAGNGMRLVILPVNDKNIVNGDVKIIGFASFLLSMDYPNGGNKAWCAIYMGSETKGSTESTEFDPGAYVIRLVQ